MRFHHSIALACDVLISGLRVVPLQHKTYEALPAGTNSTFHYAHKTRLCCLKDLEYVVKYLHTTWVASFVYPYSIYSNILRFWIIGVRLVQYATT